MFLVVRVVVAVAVLVTVPVPVMEIRHVRMAVQCAPVNMRVRVLAFGHRVVDVIVMRIVVTMRVLVLERLVHMRMLVPLREMQHEPRHHDGSRDDRERPRRFA